MCAYLGTMPSCPIVYGTSIILLRMVPG
jgi:hypothetical protein